MEIGVIGINEYAKGLCRHWIRKGHKVLFADLHLSGNSYAFAEELGPQLYLSLTEKVALQCEVVVLAVPFRALETTLESLDISHKIVIDLVIENPSTSFMLNETSFQMIRRIHPDAKVVKVTSRSPFNVLNLDSSDKQTLYSYSHDDLAQRMVRRYIDGTGFQMIDLQLRKTAL